MRRSVRPAAFGHPPLQAELALPPTCYPPTLSDDSHENPATTAPDESTDHERQATWFERWLERASLTSAFYTYAQNVHYFSAAGTEAAMDGEQVQFCVEDCVARDDDRILMLGHVDRTFGDIDSHEPHPQRYYRADIERNGGVPEEQFSAFMKTGIPPRGTVLVSWYWYRYRELMAELIPEAQLRLLDRPLYAGDKVKRSTKDHMSGTVIGSSIVCTLLPLSGRHDIIQYPSIAKASAIKAVPAGELLSVHKYNHGSLVVYKDWIGIVKQVDEQVAVCLSNNSVVRVEQVHDLEPDDPSAALLSVGDLVHTNKENLRRGEWLHKVFDPWVQPKGTIVEIRTKRLKVHWLARRFFACGAVPADHLKPPSCLEAEDLESPDFHIYEAARDAQIMLPISSDGTTKSYDVAELAFGDRVKFKDLTAAVVKYDGTQVLPNGSSGGELRLESRKEDLEYDMNIFLVAQTLTKVAVQWQDLTITQDMSQTLIPDLNDGDDDEAWPGEIVCSVEQQQSHDPDASWLTVPARVGVVQSVTSRDRIATVRWFETFNVRFAGKDLIPPVETGRLLDATEDVSLYDIRSTPGLNRRRSDFVVIHPDSAVYKLNGELASTTNAIDWFGEVVDLGLDGLITVRLGAALPVVDVRVRIEHVTLVYSSDTDNPFGVMPTLDGESLEDDEDSDYEPDFDTDSLEDAMWVDTNGEPIALDENEDWSTEDEEVDGDVSMPDAMAQDNINTSITTPEAHSDSERKEPSSATEPNLSSTDSALHPVGSSPTPLVPAASLLESVLDADTEALPPFLVLDTPPPANHQYLFKSSTSSSSSSSSSSSFFMRRIAKEHKILRSSLPPGIFVRTWESRLDLIRVLMIGPSDTPYEYAPFTIDFYLDSSYPSKAPETFFHSWTEGNGPVNPNLYEDGKICLSLLGTWHADERNESWSPGKSTLLQVLVSIMGLVLVKEPYYNEAGYDVHRSAPETKLSSALYTERAYFRARAFIAHALSNEIEPFQNELRYLYLNQADSAPKLLDKAIVAARSIVKRSEQGGDKEERDGMYRISPGAIVMLKRQVAKLEALKTKTGTAT